jgi:cyclophilin family peptidyl-prolyl cis-trans isomerase
MTALTKSTQILFTSFLFVFMFACNATDKTNEVKKVKTKETSTQMTKSTGATMSNPIIKMETSKGTITLELDAKNAPISTANMVSYVEDGFYDGIIFHRVIPNFMAQTGGMNPDMSEKPNKAKIKNEANNGLKNDRGTLAMARTPDPHSASSQFFINLKDNDFLNFTSESQAGWGYAVFGKVTDGMDVVDEIAKVKTGNHGGHGDVPLEAVTIIKATVAK